MPWNVLRCEPNVSGLMVFCGHSAHEYVQWLPLLVVTATTSSLFGRSGR